MANLVSIDPLLLTIHGGYGVGIPPGMLHMARRPVPGDLR